jgi:hypothetical protein
MSQKKKRSPYRIATVFILLTGILLVIISFYISSFLTILGVTLAAWGSILLYLRPTTQVPLTLLAASANPDDSTVERILTELNLTEKGIYLPPKNLQTVEQSLIFVPKNAQITLLPTSEETNGKFFLKENGVLLTPSGLSLSHLFEQELGITFARTTLENLQKTLPKLLTEDLELAETVVIKTENNLVTVDLTGNILNEICQQASNQPRTHMQTGCLLSSAIACALAKASGKPVVIKTETQNVEAKTTTIEYTLKGE